MEDAGDDLDLLMSLDEDGAQVVLETPPSSPPPAGGHGVFTPPRAAPRPGGTDMSVFRDAVKDYIEAVPASTSGSGPKRPKFPKSTQTLVDNYSGLRIKNMAVSPPEIADRFADVRFVRISAFQNLAGGDTFSGCWATAGVVLDKGTTRVSAQGQDYSIWKMGALDDSEVSVFLFGDAHTHYSGGAVGDVFALFNGNVRMDKAGKGFSVSVGSVGQMMKMGVSADFSLCKGKRKDGMACTMATNKRKGSYCKFHSSNTSSQKHFTGRAELKGGNFQFAANLRSRGIYMVKPPSEQSGPRNPSRPVKVMSIDGLKRALSHADKVTSKNNSQGIRFLSHVTGGTEPKLVRNGATVLEKPMSTWSSLSAKLSASRRATSSGTKLAPKPSLQKQEQDAKRRKANEPPGNTIELDLGSSDDEEIDIVLRR
ncbi:protein MCM10 homolog [Lolium rigidum]|uniref:protein MCM10 homolog n=1 Tax=Lolium rigidum TaxID=89674 RepID=UPI001F5C862F|nr:protein MCM10 homolog [Lolium rigidum]